LNRGGSWNNNANNCRVSNRNNNNPGSNNIGFHCVRSSETAPGWERNSDPAAVLSEPDHVSGPAKTQARPGQVASADAPSNAPGGRFSRGKSGVKPPHSKAGCARKTGWRLLFARSALECADLAALLLFAEKHQRLGIKNHPARGGGRV